MTLSSTLPTVASSATRQPTELERKAFSNLIATAGLPLIAFRIYHVNDAAVTETRNPTYDQLQLAGRPERDWLRIYTWS